MSSTKYAVSLGEICVHFSQIKFVFFLTFIDRLPSFQARHGDIVLLLLQFISNLQSGLDTLCVIS